MARIKKTDEEIKAEIIEAANHLFIKYGYFKTTMEDIASAVKKGKSTLYYYYKSKDDVFLDVISKIGNSLLIQVREKVNDLNSASEKLLKYFEELTNQILKVSNLYNLLLDELKDNNIIQHQTNILYFEKDMEFLESILVYGIERKEFLSITLDEVKGVAILITLINRSLITTFLMANKNDEWAKSVRLISEIFLRGIR